MLVKSDWEVRHIALDDAQRLVQQWHYSKGYQTHAIYAHGLYRRADGWFGASPYGAATWLNAVMLSKRFGLPAGPLMLTRLVVDPEAPNNAASFLLAHSMTLIDRARWPVLVTYADTGEGHTGAIYRASNWTYDGVGGSLVYYHPRTGQQMSSFGVGGKFMPCPSGWVQRDSIKHRFIHRVDYAPAVAASSDAADFQSDEGGSQPTLPLQDSLGLSA